MKKILITGGYGFIGSHLVDLYVKNNWEVHVLESVKRQRRWTNKRAHYYQIDCSSADEIEKIIKLVKPNVLNHHLFFSISEIKKRDNWNVFRENIDFTQNIVSCCLKQGCKKIIYASSVLVYEDFVKNNLNLEPNSLYGLAKLVSEKIIAFEVKKYNAIFICLRYTNVYGPRQVGDSEVIFSFWNSIRKGLPPRIYKNKLISKNFLYISNLLEFYSRIIKSNKSETITMSSEQITTIGNLSGLIKSLMDGEKMEKSSLVIGLKKTINWLNKSGDSL